MHNRFGISAFALFLSSCAGSNPAAAPVPVVEPAAVIAPQPVATEPEYCEQVRDGNTVARIQTEVEQLLVRLRPNPAFAWAKYEHAPCYRVVLAFTDGQPRPAILAAASPELRKFIRFVPARLPFSHAQFEQARQDIFAALRPTRVQALIAVAPAEQQIDIGVRTEADAQLVRSVIPVRYRAITKVTPGGYSEPIPERG